MLLIALNGESDEDGYLDEEHQDALTRVVSMSDAEVAALAAGQDFDGPSMSPEEMGQRSVLTRQILGEPEPKRFSKPAFSHTEQRERTQAYLRSLGYSDNDIQRAIAAARAEIACEQRSKR